MIGFLKGKLEEVSLDTALVDVAGVGYEVYCSQLTLIDLQAQIKKNVQVWIYTHVREDALQLFGFMNKVEKEFFLSLLKVNGIGPKMAITIMSGATVDQIREMIESENAKKLSSLPKVGKKTAEQMILTLKGKLVFATEAKSLSPQKSDITSALINLGFKAQEVEKVVGDLPPNIEMQEGIRLGLAALSGN